MKTPHTQRQGWDLGARTVRLAPAILFIATFALYAATAAPATLFGDPSEYQFIPAILGIAHPPGYAFYTLLAKLWQTLLPLGTVAFRTNLLAAAVGAWTVTAAYLSVWDIGKRYALGPSAGGADPGPGGKPGTLSRPHIVAASLLAALSLATAADHWQHAIHANAHIVSAALATTHVWLLIRWWRTERDRWLAAFALTLGWAATHHPITLFGLPAYGLFILVARPSILRQWRPQLIAIACLLIGLLPLLYYPLRSPSAPFGPTDMRTWEGFVGHVTARGLRVNLFHFGLPDQPDRALVFWSLLRLQFPLPTIALIVVGLVWLARRTPKPAVLVLSFLITHLVFTLNTVQDVMAYLLLPFASLAVAAGLGSLALFERLARPVHNRYQRACKLASYLYPLLLVTLPLSQAVRNLDRGISLRDFDAAETYVSAVYERFSGQGERALLLSAWEYLTPIWVHTHTQDQALSGEDVELVYVSTANPWVESVWAHIEDGPIYLSDYRPAVRDAGFRLIPAGPLYRVAAPGAITPTPDAPLDIWADGRVHILGYDLAAGTVRAGESLALTLYQSVAAPLDGIWMPYAQLGPVQARWTTDSRVLTSQWQPGEVVAERYELPIPFTLPPGQYPLRLGYADLTAGRPTLPLSAGKQTVEMTTVTVLPNPDAPRESTLKRALANLDNQIALMNARARAGWQTRSAAWDDPLSVRSGQALHLVLTWRALASPRDSYTVFIHLIDGAGRPVAGHDYTPLGGACPTYLWFPKWLPQQTLRDPYRMIVPSDVAPGDYWLEVGLYGMTSHRRLSVVDLAGLAGDRILLGPVRVD